MSYDLLFIITSLGIVLILFLINFIHYRQWEIIEWPWSKEKQENDNLYEQIMFQRQVEKANAVYEDLKSMIGKDIDKMLEDYDYYDTVEILNHIGDIMNLSSCSTDEFIDVLNALGTPSAETIETQKQKEPQVIFEPKVMIIEPEGQKPIKIASENIISIKQDDEIKPSLDEWYEKFMEEIKTWIKRE